MTRVSAFIIALLNVAGWCFVLKFGLQWVHDVHETMRRVTDLMSVVQFIVLPSVSILASIIIPAIAIRRGRNVTALGAGIFFLTLLLAFSGWTLTRDYPAPKEAGITEKAAP